MYLAANQVGDGRPASAIRHMQSIDLGGLPQLLSGQMNGGSKPGRGEVDLARLSFGERDKFLQAVRGHRRMHDKNER